MSIVGEEQKHDGDSKDEQENLQWSAFREYNGPRHTGGIKHDLNTVKLLFKTAFSDQDNEDKVLQCKKVLQDHSIGDLKSSLYKSKPCANHSNCTSTVKEYGSCRGCVKDNEICIWQTLVQSFFQKKPINLVNVKWKRSFYLALSLDVVDKCEERFTKDKQHDVLGIFQHQKKVPVNFDQVKPDPIYSRYGELRNGFYISSNGLVFSCEHEAKAEEKKLLSRRMESQEESDQDDEPKENQQLNKQSKMKDNVQRKSGLFASLTASLSAARSGIQGFLERSTSPKECRRSTQQVSTDHNDDSEDETGALTQLNMQVPTEDGIDNHDEFTRQMEARGGLMYESADKTVHQLSHDALPPPLSLQNLPTRTSQLKE
ncbi:uncharacterized protein [Montipora foliosa]|uniref:uncharacterized protein isoform X2 n=1 Tax=Montipora foliosa TaxID=591990 RepID=UPI0035F1C965